MKNISFALLLVAAVALFGTVTTAWAEETTSPAGTSARESYGQANRFEVEPFIGNHYFENKQNLNDSFTYGGRLGYNFNNHFGVEGSLGVVNSHVDNNAKVGAFMGQYRFPTKDVDLNYLGINAIYQFTPEKRFSPFVVLGASKFSYSPQVLGNNTNTLDYGVGAKYWMKKDVALRADLRDQRDNHYHNYSGTFGVVFAFGGKTKHAPAAVVKPEPIPEVKEVPVVPEESPVVEDNVITPAPEEKTIVLVFEDVHFHFDKSTLTDTAKAILQRNIQILKDHPHTRILIAGCTSASGSDEYNQRLSERRVRSVEKYLLSEGGISQNRLTTIGYGEHKPAEYEPHPKELYSKAALANMRVLFETIVR